MIALFALLALLTTSEAARDRAVADDCIAKGECIYYSAPKGEIGSTICTLSGDGIYSRGEHYTKASCKEYYHAIVNAQGRSEIVFFCWVLDPCSRRKRP